MDFVTMAVSSVGNVKEVNQDYYFFEQGRTERGNIVFAILCDGMGGLQQGEFASKTVVEAFKAWGKEHLADYALGEFVDAEIRREWTELVNRCNHYLHAYGRERGISLGTTLTVLLMTEERYYIMNIGDSRAYALEAGIRQLTRIIPWCSGRWIWESFPPTMRKRIPGAIFSCNASGHRIRFIRISSSAHRSQRLPICFVRTAFAMRFPGRSSIRFFSGTEESLWRIWRAL